MYRLLRAAMAAVSLATVLALPSTTLAADPPRVAIIVGPVGALTPTYLSLAEHAAATAERHGAVVARAYSPNATPAAVLAAVADANVVVYFGHGWGHPSPYGGLNTAKMNGWGLQGPAARGTHSDASGQIAYYGEDWIVANARPAPGFVMIYSNTCYAPGASEGGHPAASARQAAERVAYYSRATFTLGGSAYFATDFDRGASDLVDRLLGSPDMPYGGVFAADHRYVPSALSTQAHPFSRGQQIWLHRSKYTDGPANYWYAFAGNPDLAPQRAWDAVAPIATLEAPLADAVDVAPGTAPRVRFSEPVLGLSASTLRLTDASGTAVPAQVRYDREAGVATLVPESPLELSRVYHVGLVAGITDEAGNGLAPGSWTFRTRLDADPLSGRLPVVLEPGAHELLRFDAAGALAERRALEVGDQRWLAADVRARLDGRDGSWLRLADGGLDGWWVRESAHAHAVGIVEDAVLEPGTTAHLRAQRYTVSALVDGTMVPIAEMGGADAPTVVDRRLVLDGRTYLRLAATSVGTDGRWVAVGPDTVPGEAAVQRVMGEEGRAAAATLSMSLGDWPAFRFDARGRVVERRTVHGADAEGLATTKTLLVGGRRFFVISGGELHGWAVLDDPSVSVLHAQPAPQPAG